MLLTCLGSLMSGLGGGSIAAKFDHVSGQCVLKSAGGEGGFKQRWRGSKARASNSQCSISLTL